MMINFTLLVLLAVAAGLLYHENGKRFHRRDDSVLLQLIAQANDGRCPRCDACHPEALKHDRYWTEFKCPKCGYTLRSHVNG